jgi:flagellar protein FlaG
MINVAPTSPTIDLTGSAAAARAANPSAPEPPPVEQPAEFRLVIEEDSRGSFIYKTLDRRTGEVVNQFPREQVLRLKETEGYAPGRVFNGRS